MGIPLNDTGRAWSLIYSQSQISQPERICDYYAPTYIAIGPMGLRIWPESEMLTGSTRASKNFATAALLPSQHLLTGRPRCRRDQRRRRVRSGHPAVLIGRQGARESFWDATLRGVAAGTPNGVLLCDGQLGRYDAEGKFDHDILETWKYTTLQEWPAFPIDCTDSAPTHFACSQRVARELPGGDDAGGPGRVDRVERERERDRDR